MRLQTLFPIAGAFIATAFPTEGTASSSSLVCGQIDNNLPIPTTNNECRMFRPTAITGAQVVEACSCTFYKKDLCPDSDKIADIRGPYVGKFKESAWSYKCVKE
ncbi:hypothetical protein K491DRAFT_715194 [Lophiostoma macrostomum CBS 122681]|uniref:Uncharacterized protein n=1 Tax=Lophiostoma macrostomum CBS 122681 TaxID=1314788 RepID=A0A6A6TAC6_9PLEO|nr:hypothetical protein K491DRAFT_715194 [Lophiostoma macrostomum CBS 122681]